MDNGFDAFLILYIVLVLLPDCMIATHLTVCHTLALLHPDVHVLHTPLQIFVGDHF